MLRRLAGAAEGGALGVEDHLVERSGTSRGSRSPRVFTLVLVVAFVLVGAASRAWAVGDRGADGEFSRRDSFHFNLYQDVEIDESSGVYGSRKVVQDLLSELAAAFDRLDALLSLRPERKIDVYVWDPALFDRQYAGLFRFPAAGFYGGAIHIRGRVRVTPPLVRVLHHELVHAAFDAEAPRVSLPAWMNEGIAEWFEARALGKRGLNAREGSTLLRLAQQGQLYALADLAEPSFGGFGPNAAAVAYLESYAFIDHLVRTHGEDDLARFWSAVVRSRSLDRGARRAYRKDLAELEAEFRRSLERR